MCTAVAYQNGALYFGRNLDYEVTEQRLGKQNLDL